ncbi:MAG: M23 family metallopeptidase [Verrucomicrobiaceae bacterium]|nr:M23 family metallopeptidase [Verrucomicrobiaceae bacterium]
MFAIFAAAWLGQIAALLPAAAQSYSTARLADGFDYPVGKPDGVGYYIFRGFSPNGHLGEDWNGKGGGDTDEGDPVYSIAHGVVVFSEDYKKGWGNVVIVRHAYRERNGQIAFVDSLYGHLKVRSVRLGQQVTRGQMVGTIGCGPYRMYAAHLHFEIRKDLRVGMRRELYPRNHVTYHTPKQFMDLHRSLRFEDRTVRVPINTFLKSNPNRITTDEVEIPELTATGETTRPKLPDELGLVIEEETEVEAATPEKSQSLFEALLKKLSNPQ